MKSIMAGRIQLKESFVSIKDGEVWLLGSHISHYSHGNINNHDAMQERKLLLQKKELRKLENKIKEKGYSIIPLKIFISEKGFAKMEIGLGKGKKNYDKRDSIKTRESDRDIKRKYGV